MRLPFGHRLLLAAAVASSDAVVARAQRQTLAPDAYAIEVHVTERHLNGREQPRFTPFRERDHWLFVDSLRRANGSRTVFVSFGEQRGATGTIITTPDGNLTRLTISSPHRRVMTVDSPEEHRRYERASLFLDFDGPLSMVTMDGWIT